MTDHAELIARVRGLLSDIERARDVVTLGAAHSRLHILATDTAAVLIELDEERVEALMLSEGCTSLKQMALGCFRGAQAEIRATKAEAALIEMAAENERLGKGVEAAHETVLLMQSRATNVEAVLTEIAEIAESEGQATYEYESTKAFRRIAQLARTK